MTIEDKPDPDQLLKAIQQEEQRNSLGRLKIFFGMAAGVGKTYAMLQEAHERKGEGIDLVIGTVNTHSRRETEKLLKGLTFVPEKWVKFKDKAFKELDLERILDMKPQLVLIDELAHTNVPGSKHPKRWQDVVEILDAGIDVYSTLNVQHLESRKDIVESITGILVHETVPDLILERATTIEIVDIAPTELLQRLKEGKVYLGDQSIIAAENFFQEDHLTALREIALRFTAEKVDHDLHGILAMGRGWKTRERLMVAVSAASSSQQLIRSARRLAFELDAPWIAVFVNTGAKLTPEDQARLNKNLQLAKELGAEVMTTNDLNIANALQRIAKQKNITRLVMGRPAQRPFLQRIFQASLLDKLESENKQLDILILRQDRLVSLYKRTIQAFQLTSPMVFYWIACGAVLFLTLVGYFAHPLIGYQAVGEIFLFGILVLSLFLGQGPILLATGLSALSWGYLFVPPMFNFAINNAHDILLIFLYFFTATIIGLLNTRIKERDVFLYRREEKVEHLYEVMREIAKSSNLQYLRLNIDAKLKALFGGEFDILVKGGDNHLIFESQISFLNEEMDRAAALWSFRQGRVAGWSTDTLPSAKAVYFPISFSKTPIAVLAYSPKDQKPLSIDEVNFLQAVTEQLGIYLERYVFEERIRNQNYLWQVEKLHIAIFRSLSKGFYAPLEKMSSMTQALKQTALRQEEKELAQEMDQATNNLKMIVDNILTISQLESGFIQFRKEKHSIRSLIEEAFQEVTLLINGHQIDLQPPEHDLFFVFDFKLMKIAIKNVLINAIEYSPPSSSIDIRTSLLDMECKISVMDKGPGISKEMIPFIFEKFYRAQRSKLEGIGLGLTIVKSVIELHQGRLEIKNREGGGTEFSLILPSAP